MPLAVGFQLSPSCHIRLTSTPFLPWKQFMLQSTLPPKSTVSPSPLLLVGALSFSIFLLLEDDAAVDEDVAAWASALVLSTTLATDGFPRKSAST